MTFEHTCVNLCKKVTGKKVSGKKPRNKKFGKKSQFSEVLGQNVTGNIVLSFRLLGFFPKIIWGLPIKVSGTKISRNKVLKKKFDTFNFIRTFF